MILLVHMLFGSAIGSSISNPYLAITLAFLGHYFLDLFPHIEYDIEDIKHKRWKKAFPALVKVFLDFLIGVLIIFIFSKNQPIVYLCGFVALIPDGLTIVSSLFPNKIMAWHDDIHTKKIHYLTKQKKFPVFWRIATQAAVLAISIILIAR